MTIRVQLPTKDNERRSHNIVNWLKLNTDTTGPQSSGLEGKNLRDAEGPASGFCARDRGCVLV